ncbi:MAG TPA: signal recognition particle protein [Actinomycetota bacterium]|nr:signal recognition particle protein [Actinomycetota bacterium]
MFDTLSERIESIFGRLRGRGRLSELQIDEVLREVRLALLEADVHTDVVRAFVGRVRERAMGEEVRKALTPAQTIVKIVNDELVEILGRTTVPLTWSPKPPTVIMLAGLQGSGKTTAAGKLARLLKSKGKRPLLVACDLRRPAAVEQLKLLGDEVDVPVVARIGISAVDVAATGLEEARRLMRDVVIVDTAGRLHIDEEMMDEAAAIRDRIRPTETLFVADAMTGQDAVNVATAFLERVDYTGIILTKLDGDARGGAALSIAHVSGRPVKFASTGERLDAFEAFHPDRLASRILGMGDILTLIEKSEEAFAEDERVELEEKMRKATFTLDDFLKQMQQMRKMGPLTNLLGMVPGMKAMKDVDFDEKELNRVEAIIQSMTPAERHDPAIINNSRRQRIARGCGRNVSDVNALVRQFDQVKVMMRAMAGGGGLPSLPRGMGPQAVGAPRPGRGKPKNRPHRPKQHAKGKKRKRR